MSEILIAGGLDPSGCSGVSAGLKAVAAHGAHGCPLITAWTAQNRVEVREVGALPESAVRAQLDALLADRRIGAAAVGLIGHGAAPLGMLDAPVVLDPVLRASTGAQLQPRGVVDALLPRATLLTPNAPEAAALTGLPVRDPDEAEAAGRLLLSRGCGAVLVKGGHLERGRGTDVLVTGSGVTRLEQPELRRSARGTGCSFAAAAACRLAERGTLLDAVRGAQDYVRGALLGAARRPVPRLHVLVDSPALGLAAARGGAGVVQYREKRPLPTNTLVERARGLRGAELIVNDRVDVAAAVGAGVHLGRGDLQPEVARRLLGERALIGATANSLEQAQQVIARSGASLDYLGVGPVYGTRSKANPAPRMGLDRLAAIVEAVPLPVIAIGSIDAKRLPEVLATGAHGVAVLSAVCAATDPEAATRALAVLL